MVIYKICPVSYLSYVIQDAEGEHFKQDRGLNGEGIGGPLRLLGSHRLVAFVLEPQLVVSHHGIEHNLGGND